METKEKIEDFTKVLAIIDDVDSYACSEQAWFCKQMAEIGAYKPTSNSFAELSVAELFGDEAIRIAFNKLSELYLSDYKKYTDLVMAVNWKAWEWEGRNDAAYSKFYSLLYYEADERFWQHFEHDDVAKNYYFQTTD